MTTIELDPSRFKAPSNHPNKDRANTDNVFAVMPVSTADAIQPGDKLQINLATYIDPSAESWVHDSVARKRRWQQGVLLGVSTIELIDDLVEPHQRAENRGRHHRSFNPGAHWPADRAFTGAVDLREEEVDAYGVIHPQGIGWIKLDAEGEPMRTIADLKHAIGKISAEEASAQNEQFFRTTSFDLAEAGPHS